MNQEHKTQKSRVLMVDDDEDLCNLYQSCLEEEGIRFEKAYSLEQATLHLRHFSFDLVLLDLQLGDQNGLDLLLELKRNHQDTSILVLTAHPTIESAVDSMKQGATSFAGKSDGLEKTLEIIHSLLKKQAQSAKKPIMIGNSEPFRNILQQISQIKDVDAPILIQGESGTGKELLARTIHAESNRKKEPFEALNCGAIPENLLEAELFGYKKGAFTDAKEDRKGIFEACGEGSLFLDEVNELTLSMQVKFLRVIQEKEIKRLGDTRTIPVKTRIICATNKDLESLVEKDLFREDLFFRLSVFPITLPPLRERQDDLESLIQHYLDLFNRRYEKSIHPPSKSLLATLKEYPWPGNIRQLQNALERAVVLAKDQELLLEHMNLKTPSHPKKEDDPLVYSLAKEAFERQFLVKLLGMTKGNVSEAARVSGRYRSDLYRLIERYGIHPDDYR